MKLRDYQQNATEKVYNAWGAGFRNVLMVLPTGGGKTVCMGHILSRERGHSLVMAHRQELISQISQALARCGVYHRIVAPKKLIQYIIRRHVSEFGNHYYDPGAPCMLASVKSLLIQADNFQRFLGGVKLWVLDEAHHQLTSPLNQWGKVPTELLPDGARGLGVTATPERSDGYGLGRWAAGLVDYMVVGPSMSELIGRGYLSPYRIFAPPTTGLDLSSVPVGSSGDFVKKKMVTAVRKSKIVGDVVGTYIQRAGGKLGVTFVPDLKTGEEMAENFNAAGVPCELVHAKTPDMKRNDAVAALGRGDLKQLVNVDIFGEGFDLPAIEVVSFARPTQSYGLYCQQFGRAVRVMDGKDHAIILDHVGNVMRHGLPDAPREWSLDNRERKRSGAGADGPPIRVCPSCTGVFEAYIKDCPFCGYKHRAQPVGRDIEQVEGDLTEMDPSVLAVMRGEIDRIDAPDSNVRSKLAHAAGELAAAGAAKRHRERQGAQAALRGTIALWAGIHRGVGRSDAEIYRRFYLGFGIDILTAQTLGRSKAEDLTKRVDSAMRQC